MNAVIAYAQKCQIWPLDSLTVLKAAQLQRKYMLAAADAMVYASALLCGAQWLTCDAHFEGLLQLHWIKKI